MTASLDGSINRPNSENSTDKMINGRILRLYSWPDMVALPDDLFPDVVRVCALLSLRPTASFLVAQLSGLSKSRCNTIINMLRAGGHLSPIKITSHKVTNTIQTNCEVDDITCHSISSLSLWKGLVRLFKGSY